MYDWQVKLFSKEKLYLAGPECFYTNGYTLWDAMRRKAEYNGFGVTMPGDNQLDMSSPDLRDHAKAIFQNCANCMNESTAILVDLENFVVQSRMVVPSTSWAWPMHAECVATHIRGISAR